MKSLTSRLKAMFVSDETRPEGLSLTEVISPGGIRFLYQSSNKGNVSIAFAFKGGTAESGLGSPLTAMLAAGVIGESGMRNSGGELGERLADLGGGLRLDPAPEATVGMLTAPKAAIREAASICASLFLGTPLDETALENTKRSSLRTLDERSDNPHAIAHKAFLSRLVRPHRLFQHLVPDVERISSVRLEDVAEWRKRNFVRSRLIACVIGDLDEATAADLIDTLFLRLQEGAAAAVVEAPEFLPVPAEPVLVQASCGEQVVVGIGGRSVSTYEPKTWLAARALAHVLAGDQNSRLFREIRDSTGKTYGLRHRFDFFAPASLFVVFGLIDANGAGKTIQLIEQSISRFLADGPTDDEQNNARRDMMTTYRQLLSDSVSSSSEIVALLLFGWPTDAINDVDDMIARLDLRAPEYRAAMLKGQPLTVISGNAN